MSDNPRIKEAMDTLLKLFESGNLEKVARAVFKGNDIPSDKWSFLNRILMYLHDTEDARGYRQWQEVGRHVKKGAKAIYILGPVMKKVTVESVTQFGDKIREERTILAGFTAIPVFRLEDTEGAPIVRENHEVKIPYEFNGIIRELGLKVGTERFNGAAYGWYSPVGREIRLASPDIEVFLHELSHAVDDRFNSLKGGQHADQEVTAEFSAAVIGHLMGYKISLGNVKEYIEHYSFKELMASLGRIEKIVNFVIDRTRSTATAGITQPAVCVIGR